MPKAKKPRDSPVVSEVPKGGQLVLPDPPGTWHHLQKRWSWTAYKDPKAFLDKMDLKLCFYQQEICPETGRQHWQGYFETRIKCRLSTLKKLDNQAHFEPSKGSAYDNLEYCRKLASAVPNTFILYCGILPTAKNDWDAAKLAVKAGNLDAPEVPAHLYLTSYRVLKEIAADHRVKHAPIDKLDNYWLWGETGIGKSRAARTCTDDFFEKDTSKWWDGYKDEATVVVEDVDETHASLLRYFKIWGDHYAFEAEWKGFVRNIRPDRIIITSNIRMKDIWHGAHLQAMERRFTEIELTKDNRDDWYPDH